MAEKTMLNPALKTDPAPGVTVVNEALPAPKNVTRLNTAAREEQPKTGTVINPALQQGKGTSVNEALLLGQQKAALEAGTLLLEKYRVEERLAVSSGEADLYRCSFDGRQFVAKVYQRQAAIKEEVVEALKKLDSPYVAKLIEVGELSGCPVEILPYYQNGSLQGKRFTEEELVNTVIPAINEGLQLLHSVGIIHKDLKPSNLMLCDDGKTVAIIDFGISSAIENGSTVLVTKTGMTPEYSAPETFKNLFYEGSDYYSFGITLFELLCGYTPYANMQPEEIEQYVSLQKIPFPEELSGRMKDLISALTYYDITNRKNKQNPHRRWTYDEVQRWLQNDPTLTIPGEGLGGRGEGELLPFLFLKEEYTNLEKLVTALGSHWNDGKKQLFRGHLTAYFKTFDRELAALCAEAEQRAARENGKDDRIYWELLCRLLPNRTAFCWKGRTFEGLPAFGREVLERLWKGDESDCAYYGSVLAEKLLSSYVKLVSPQNEPLLKAAVAIEDSYTLEKQQKGSGKRSYFLMGYTLSGQKLFYFEGQQFSTVGEFAGYLKEVLDCSKESFITLCRKLCGHNGRLDLQFESWLIAIGKQAELERWQQMMES